jgi:hypothetical protein
MEKYEINFPEAHLQSRVGVATSWLLAGMAGFICLVLAQASSRFVRPFAVMFQGLGVELAWPTRFLVTHGWLPSLPFCALAVFVIVRAALTEGSRKRRLTSARVLCMAAVTAGLVMFVLYLPLLTIASKLSDTK